jgi:trk system potassium uptake protein
VKIVIVGCGRVGASAAELWDTSGNEVVILDMSTRAFERLPSTFGGTAVRGDGTDEDVLRRAGAEGADVFVALTEGDNRNVMSAQLATEALDARQVIAKINDPLRASAYAELGIATLCRTNLMASAVMDFLGLDLTFGPGLSPPTGQHPGGEHHGPPDAATPGSPGSPVVARAAADDPVASPSSFSAAPAVAAPAEPIPAPVAPATAREG